MEVISTHINADFDTIASMLAARKHITISIPLTYSCHARGLLGNIH